MPRGRGLEGQDQALRRDVLIELQLPVCAEAQLSVRRWAAWLSRVSLRAAVGNFGAPAWQLHRALLVMHVQVM